MGGKASRDKGNRFERALVIAMNAVGLDAKRVPLSGAAAGFPGDVHYHEQGDLKVMECKCRKKGFGDLYEWLDEPTVDRLAIKRDGREPLIVFRLADYLALAGDK